jgi:Trypsin-like peptidase domain
MTDAAPEQRPGARIDQYSAATVPIRMFFNDSPLSVATGFIWVEGERFFLITNWHNVSGRNPFTGQHISPTAAEPNSVTALLNAKERLGGRVSVSMPLFDESGGPLWWVHPTHRERIDVVALPLTPPPEAEMYPINRMPSRPLLLQVGLDVFVLGYPFGVAPGGFPVWKRGSIASEPEILRRDHPYVLIDTTSREGMSGSPVIRRSWGSHSLEGGNTALGGEATRLVGVYSGRLATIDPLEAQLGLCWPIRFLEEIIEGGGQR